MNTSAPFTKFDKLIFDTIAVSVKREFGRMLFVKNNFEVDTYVQMGAMAMVAELRAYLMVRRRESHEEKKIIVYNMCPHANIKWDKSRGPHITFLETGEYYPDLASNSNWAVP